MLNDFDIAMLRRAIRNAMRGRGSVEPNPMVGCILTRDGQIIGEGIHERYGQPHAEPNALADCRVRGHDPAGATAYVTLEPCCHLNKQTPPCAPRLIEARITRVVVGCVDPNPDVNGHGLAMLRDAGINLDRADASLEAEAKQLIAPFIARTIERRPYVTLKWAQSRNGKVAGPRGERLKITNATSDRVVQGLRSRCDAIAVGTNTVLNDDPLLTARVQDTPRRPLRVVLSNTLKLPLDRRLIQSAGGTPVVVYCSHASATRERATVDALRARNVEVVTLPDRDDRFSFTDVLTDLFARRAMHLLIEPGPTLTHYFLQHGQADRIWVFTSPRDLPENGLSISTAPSTAGYIQTGSLDLDGDQLVEYLNQAGTAFFAPTTSADLVQSGVDDSTAT